MKQILKQRWIIFSIWIITTILLTVFQPDINAILRLKGQGNVSSSAPSRVADSVLSKMNGVSGKDSIIVFYNKNKFTDTDLGNINSGIKAIITAKSELGIDKIIDPFTMPDAKRSLISPDNTTMMVTFLLDKKGREIDDIIKAFNQKLKNVKVQYYLTGEEFINNDYLKVTQSGVEKSAAITVIFILVILILMFRSVVTPFVSLLGVGISYLCSMGITAQLIDKFNFPVTSLTQMLLVLIIFGIGTDYNILLFNRFKEEMAKGISIDEAIVATYRTAGKTILFSILTVFIAFLSLGFAKYGIYQSGIVVAIGTAVLITEIFTFTPFIMKTIGKKLFWPSKHSSGHKESKVWEKATTLSVKNPIVSAVLILGFTLIVFFTYSQRISFDTLKELGDTTSSSKGFNIVAKHFSRGQAMPTMVAIESTVPMDNNEYLSVIDNLTEKIDKVPGVKKVIGPTQPEGKQIKDFYISDQTQMVSNGIAATKDGVDKIHNGLKLISSNLKSPDFSSVSQLVSGTGAIAGGMSKITDGMYQVGTGIKKGADGAGSISSGILKVKDGLSLITEKTTELSNGLIQLKSGYSFIRDGYRSLEKQLPGIQAGLGSMNLIIGDLGKKYEKQLSSDKQYATLKQTGSSLESALAQLSGGAITAGKYFDTMNSNFTKAADGLKQLNGGQKQLVDGLAKLQQGSQALSSGLRKGSNGQMVMVKNMKLLQSGLTKIKDGQQQLYNGLNKLSGGMGQLKGGIDKSSNGLSDISDGLGKTNSFMKQLNGSKTFFIPKEALTSSGFKKALDNFMSSDRKITKLMVILDNDPYSEKSISTIDNIQSTVSGYLSGTILSDSTYSVGGPSSRANDMSKVLTSDLSRTKIIVIIGVFLVLVLIIRSIWIPIYIVGSLLGAYYLGMAATSLITSSILKADGFSSFVPFFAFIIIVSLGVDYSIFLMMRYKEYTTLSPKEAIINASKNIGGVVISAGVILGGTFATMIPSGLSLMIELSTAVIVGLAALCLLFLPLFLPALIVLPDTITEKDKVSKSSATES